MPASGISKSEVSRICSELDKEMEAFRARRLDHVAFPYLFCDATYVKGRLRGRVVSRAVVVVTGVTAEGNREVLGCDVGDSEDGTFWTAFLRGLHERGLSGVAARHLRSAPRTERGDREGLHRGRLATLPGALLTQRALRCPEGEDPDGRRRHPDDLRPAWGGARQPSSST